MRMCIYYLPPYQIYIYIYMPRTPAGRSDATLRASAPRSARKGTNGVSTNGVTANFR